MYVCVCVFQHNSGTPGAISTKLGTHMAICMYIYKSYVYIIYIISIYNNKNRCVYVCSSITLERLERFQPNL
jgi:hypothetical protein